MSNVWVEKVLGELPYYKAAKEHWTASAFVFIAPALAWASIVCFKKSWKFSIPLS